MREIFRTKPIESLIDETKGSSGLKKVLGPFGLIMLGIGAIVGTGIFVITGLAAAKFSGPALVISFLIAGAACALSAMVYAEFASTVPVAGSAYTYSYASLGEIWAWIIGWDIILEYVCAISSVSIGWSGYVVQLFSNIGITLPKSLTTATVAGGIINLPAVLIIGVIMCLVIVGISQSTKINNVIVAVKLFVILMFIILAAGHIKVSNWHPFMPFGWAGVMSGAAYVFYAYLGFDAVSTAAEEVKNPQKDLPKGIIGSVLICTVLYIVVSFVLTGIVPYYKFMNTDAPVAYALEQIGINWGSALISVGAICGITSVLLVMTYGSSRILFAISRDGLLPRVFGRVNAKTKTPVLSTVLVSVVTATLAGILPLDIVTEFVNIGTLAAFIIVDIGIIFLRKRQPNLKRGYKCPFVPVLPIVSVIFCIVLVCQLGTVTKIRFVVWFALGLIIYFAYGRKHSLNRQAVPHN